MINIYMTNGTVDYLQKIKKQNSNENMILMANEDNGLLLHETSGGSLFNEPRSYEVLDSVGSIQGAGFAVMNNIAVSDEGRPLFEHRFKNRARQIENEEGFVAIRVLRPLSSDTYIILTLWEEEKYFVKWQESKAFDNAHQKRPQTEDSNAPQIFARPSYVTKYIMEK